MKKVLSIVLVCAFLFSCKKDNLVREDENKESTPNNMASVTVDTVNATGVFPLYRGQDANGGDVYYVLTESTDVGKAIDYGLNWSPKIIHALGTAAVQTATVVSGGPKNPNDFPILKFSGNVDFSPVRKLVPGPDLYPLDPSSQPGSAGDANYSPLVTFDGKIIYNASHLSNSTGVHDKVISMDKEKMTVTIKLTRGFYEGFPILYTSTETSDDDLASLEDNTFAPNMNTAPNPGDDKSFRSAREAIIPVINGQMGTDNPNRQGLRSAVAGEGDPLNIFQEQAGCEDSDDPSSFCDAASYSPFWDATPVMWTDAAIASGARVRVRTDKREVIEPLNIIELYADGFLLAGGFGNRNASLGGINAAGLAGGPGIIINCPIVFVPPDAR